MGAATGTQNVGSDNVVSFSCIPEGKFLVTEQLRGNVF